ncbi:DUF1129 family protein [Sporolactobacillus pectinivorans]|uniref:DUF1129 family protein n=1 Tax=Sporolactobacillus pectinivorans TaxID=1591408 RepID=UPI000C257D22|nr:DUF1129 family protein [Sporolactobacillus pectinivorans]
MVNLSKESRDFLGNLRLYLISDGKKEKDIEEIVGELEDHLYEAEKDGKSVENIIGKSPKIYMDQLANELPVDSKVWQLWIPLIMIGVMAYNLLGKAINGAISYSLLELIGNILITLFSLVLIAVLFKYVASSKASRIKERLLFFLFGITPVALFVVLIYLDQSIHTPSVHFGTAGMIIAIVLACLFFAGISMWSKSWAGILIPMILFLPELLLKRTGFSEPEKDVISMALTFFLMGIYIFLLRKRRKTINEAN